jgi:hypothetical protein
MNLLVFIELLRNRVRVLNSHDARSVDPILSRLNQYHTITMFLTSFFFFVIVLSTCHHHHHHH